MFAAHNKTPHASPTPTSAATLTPAAPDACPPAGSTQPPSPPRHAAVAPSAAEHAAPDPPAREAMVYVRVSHAAVHSASSTSLEAGR